MKNLFFVLFFLIILTPRNVFAQIGLPKQPDGRGVKFGGDDAVSNLGTIITNTITIFFAIGGIGFTIMILWGAVDWILSGGDKEKVAGARKRITTAITGLVLLSLAFVIIFVLGQILNLKFLYSGEFEIKGLNE